MPGRGRRSRHNQSGHRGARSSAGQGRQPQSSSNTFAALSRTEHYGEYISLATCLRQCHVVPMASGLQPSTLARASMLRPVCHALRLYRDRW